MPGNDWTLTHPGGTVRMGPYSSGIMFASPPDLGDLEVRSDDADRPREDGRAFGVDLLGGRTVTFDLLVLGEGEADTRDRLAALTTLWRADSVRGVPGAFAELSTVNAGRERVVFGRPRRFAVSEQSTGQGVGRVVADFACVDGCWYGPAVEQAVVGLVPPPSGGLLAPLAGPLATVAATIVPGAITVGGDLPAWPVITFVGPVTGPSVQVTGLWTYALDVTVPAGQQVTVDTRPWARTVTRPDGASFAGAATRGSPRLAAMGMPPGRYEVALRGVDVSGTALVRFAWRNTFSSL